MMTLASKDLSISGLAREGHELVAVHTLADARLSAPVLYQWKADGNPLSGATDSVFVPGAAQVGQRLSVSLTYTDLTGRVQTVESAATPEIVATEAGQGVRVEVKLSQQAIDAMAADDDGEGNLNQVMDTVVQLQAKISSTYAKSVRYQVTPDQLISTYSDGSTRELDYVKDDPLASSGVASVSRWAFSKPGAFIISYEGALRYRYDEAAGSLKLLQGVMNEYSLQSVMSTGEYGRQTVKLRGALQADGGSDPQLAGELSSIHVAASQVLKSAVFEGRLQVSGDVNDIAQGLATSRVQGILTGLQQEFHDGSYLRLSGDLDATPPWIVDGRLDEAQWMQMDLPGDDVFSLSLPALVGEEWGRMETGPGRDRITLEGGDGSLEADAGPGDDTVASLAGSHRLAGGDGQDTLILPRPRADYLLQWASDGTLRIESKADGVDVATGFERYEFDGQPMTAAQLRESRVLQLELKTWNQVRMGGIETPLGRTDAQGLMAIMPSSPVKLPADLQASAAARQHVNLADAIVVLKSIVGLVELQPHQRLAADFDGVAGVNLADAIGILKHVVGLPTVQPAWKLMNGPTGQPVDATASLQLTADQRIELVGVLIGDVDGSWTGG